MRDAVFGISGLFRVGRSCTSYLNPPIKKIGDSWLNVRTMVKEILNLRGGSLPGLRCSINLDTEGIQRFDIDSNLYPTWNNKRARQWK